MVFDGFVHPMINRVKCRVRNGTSLLRLNIEKLILVLLEGFLKAPTYAAPDPSEAHELTAATKLYRLKASMKSPSLSNFLIEYTVLFLLQVISLCFVACPPLNCRIFCYVTKTTEIGLATRIFAYADSGLQDSTFSNNEISLRNSRTDGRNHKG
jgi:hypothetical protein